MDLRQLRYYSAVATLGSFSRAAEQLHVAQSAISRQIQALEEEIGVDLLRRKPKLQPTEAGILLLERAASIIGQVRALRDDVREYADVPKGVLRIGMVPFSGQVFMPRAITRFVQEFRDVRVQVQTAMSGVQIGWLRDDAIDVAIMHSPWAGLEFACEPLVYGAMVLVLPPGPTAFTGDATEPFTLAQVAPMPLILATTENPQRVLLEGAALAQGLTLNVVLEADNLATILALVHEGLGCTVIAYGAVHAMAGTGEVRIASLVNPIRTDVSFVTNAKRPLTAAIRQFCRVVKSEIQAVAAREEIPPQFFQLAPGR